MNAANQVRTNQAITDIQTALKSVEQIAETELLAAAKKMLADVADLVLKSHEQAVNPPTPAPETPPVTGGSPGATDAPPPSTT